MVRAAYGIPIALICFSYFFTAVILLDLGADTRQANFIIKGIIISIVSLFILRHVFFIRKKFFMYFIFIIFLMIYGIRVIYDIFIENIIIALQNPIYIIGYYFFLTVMPIIMIFMYFKNNDIFSISKISFWMIFLSNVALVYYYFTTGLGDLDRAFAGRAEVLGDMEGLSIINPIGVALMGCMLAIFSLASLAFDRMKSSAMQLVYTASIGVGVFNLLSGGSRGPVVAFLVALLALLYALSKGRNKALRSVWLYLGAGAIGVVYLLVSGIVSIGVLDRFTAMFEQRSQGIVEQRDVVFNDAIRQFFESPFFGKSYAISIEGSYGFPHNVVLEAFFATGIVGGIFFIILMAQFLMCLFRILNGHAGPLAIPIALLAICQMVLGLTSYSISQSPELWIMIALVLAMGSARSVSEYARSGKPNSPIPPRQANQRNIARLGVGT